MLDRLRQKMLARWTAFVCDRPVMVVIAALVLAALAVSYTALQLEFQSDRNDLISRELDWNRRYIEYRDELEGRDRIVAMVSVPEGPVGRRRAEEVVQRLASRFQQDQVHVEHVWWRIEARPILLRLEPLDVYRSRMADMAQAGPLLRSRSVGQFIGNLASQLRQGDSEGGDEARAIERIEQLSAIVQSVGAVAGGAEPSEALAVAQLSAGPEFEYLQSPDGKLLVLDVQVRPLEGEVDPFVPGVAAIRRDLAEVQAEFPDVPVGLTGIPVIEADETLISMRDSTLASAIAVTAIAVLLVFAFHGWMLPLLSVAALLVGVAWSFGFLTLAIGHLQVLSVVFTVILLGLGIDFAIHIISRFELVRHDHGDDLPGFCGAMRDTLEATGPGIITGAVTTAFAFATTMFTDFKGMAEMGLIAGVGVLLCMASMLLVLPALMRLLRPGVAHIKPTEHRPIDLHAQDWIMPFVNHPYLTLVAAGVIALASAWGMSRVEYDYNLLNMMPRELESVRLIDALAESGQPVWDAIVVTTDLEQARQLTEELHAADTVQSVGGIGWLFPADEERKLALAAEVRQALGEEALRPEAVADVVPAPQDSPATLRQQLGGLALALRIAMDRPDVRETPRIQQALARLSSVIEQADQSIQGADGERLKERIDVLQTAFREAITAIRVQIADATDPRELTLQDLPPYLRREAFVDSPTRYIIKAYPREDVWDPQKLARFLADVRYVAGDENVIGSSVQIYESGELMKQSYKLAGTLAVLVVFVLIFIDFWNLLDAVLCMLPVALAFVTTFGIMYVAGVSINPANLMVMPLMFGIGVASGVHMIHRYRQAPFARPLGLSEGTGKGIILTSLTTIIAFSSMLLAEHRGIRSLGFVLAVGITMTLVACMSVAPAILEIRNRYRARRRSRPWQLSR